MRRAINILLDRGLVTTTQGKGTFVRSMDMGEAIFRLQEITDVWADDDSVEVLLLEARIVARRRAGGGHMLELPPAPRSSTCAASSSARACLSSIRSST